MNWMLFYTSIGNPQHLGRKYHCPKCQLPSKECECPVTNFTIEEMGKSNWKI